MIYVEEVIKGEMIQIIAYERLIMLVKEIMIKDVITIHPQNTVYDGCLLYRDKKVGCLVVEDKGTCTGIVTERDIIERTICEGKNPKTTSIQDIMSSNIKTVDALESIESALTLMETHKIKKLPVMNNQNIVGIITVTDISKAKPDISKRFIESWVKPRWKD